MSRPDAALLEFGGPALAGIVFEIGNDHVGAGRTEPLGQGEAEHAGPADDDGRLAFDGEQVVKVRHEVPSQIDSTKHFMN